MLKAAKTPWHFWVLAILGLLWFAGGGYDYVMTITKNQAYLAMLTEPQLAWIMDRPWWFTVAWTLSIWASILGGIAMLFRSRFAVTLFALGLFGYILACLWSYVFAPIKAWEISGTMGLVMGLLIGFTIVFFWLYNQSMRDRGVLK